MQACKGKLQKTPIFITLREWAESEMPLLEFIELQFGICSFPNAKSFITYLLETGNAIVLFDGLDEIVENGNRRQKAIVELLDFANRYYKTQVCISCRNAATDYSFEHFTYLEIADFNDKQIRLFARKWFQHHDEKYTKFIQEILRPENRGLYEMARTPLLLALLCLSFEEMSSFPSRKADLYRDAIDALIKKWDASRGIRRDVIYRNLSHRRKILLLAHIATHNFEIGRYYFRQDILEKQILRFFQSSFSLDIDSLDGESILRAIESQHGILIQRAHRIYSFAHLSFQEYFTAWYIAEQVSPDVLSRLLREHLFDDRWREVILLTASLLEDVDLFFELFTQQLALFLHDEPYVSMMKWVSQKVQFSSSLLPVRSMLLALLAALTFSLADYRSLDLTFTKDLARLDQIRIDTLFPERKRVIMGSNMRSLASLVLSRSIAFSRIAMIENSPDVYSEQSPERYLGYVLLHDIETLSNAGMRMTSDDFLKVWEFTPKNAKYMANFVRSVDLLLECNDLAAPSGQSTLQESIWSLLESFTG